MKKFRYSAGLKTIAVLAQQIFSVILVLSVIILAVLFQKNILDFGDMKNKSFESSGYFASRFQETTEELLNFIELRRKFETGGSYDDEKVVDIWNYYKNQEISEQGEGKKEKERNTVKYTLGDLAEWSKDHSSSEYEFVSEYRLDNGIQQKRNIYKNGNVVFSEEKSISSLEEMTAELQENIVENVEHYYGGSYSISGKETAAYGKTEQTQTTENLGESQPDEFSDGEASAIEASSTVAGSQEAEGGQTNKASQKLQEIVDKVIGGKLYELNVEELGLLLRDMNMSYSSNSVTYEFVNEEYLPIEGVGIWDNFMKGNRSMEQMCNEYKALAYTLDNIGTEISQYKKCLNRYNLTKEGSNVYYWIAKGNEDTIYTNITESIEGEFPEYGEQKGKYVYYRENDIRLETNVKGMEDIFYSKLEPQYGGKGNVLFICVDTSFSHADAFREAKLEYNRMHPWIYISLMGAVISVLVCLIFFIYLSMVTGRQYEEDTVQLNLFDRIPTEILFLLAVAEGIGFFLMFWAVLYWFDNGELAGLLIMSGVLTFFSMAFFLLFYLSFVRRIRAGVLWSGSILNWFVNGIALLFTNRRSVTKMVIWFGLHLLGCLIIIPMMMVYYDTEIHLAGVLLFLLLCGVEGVMIIREGAQRGKVMEGISKIAQGDLEYKIAAEELKGDNRRLAEAVNDIGDGLYHAVEASMKNEHLKADLITNVSHDIKTPLTSIINYVDLLKREDLQNERVQNYIAVLDSKSQRLKQLTEDLVEASKVSSGNITLEMERINLVELVYQTGGEFAERFEARGLTTITKLPREPVVILADGRRIWRVLENLYNNVAKYAMENTRVYVDMEADGAQVLFSIKNISENPLNIQADELTERFIRGDISRSTEGSGLGLSIAKSLTTLMGGTFEIYLDGDLFKAMIGFKQEPASRELPREQQENPIP